MSETDLVNPEATSGPRKRAGLTGMVLADLRQLAGELRIPGTTGMRKGDLIAAIKERQGGAPSRARAADQLTLPDNGASTAPAGAPAQPEPDRASDAGPPAVAPVDLPAATTAPVPPTARRRRTASRPAGAPLQPTTTAPATDPTTSAGPPAAGTAPATDPVPPAGTGPADGVAAPAAPVADTGSGGAPADAVPAAASAPASDSTTPADPTPADAIAADTTAADPTPVATSGGEPEAGGRRARQNRRNRVEQTAAAGQSDAAGQVDATAPTNGAAPANGNGHPGSATSAGTGPTAAGTGGGQPDGVVESAPGDDSRRRPRDGSRDESRRDDNRRDDNRRDDNRRDESRRDESRSADTRNGDTRGGARTDSRADGRTDSRTDGRTDSRTDGRTDSRTDSRTDNRGPRDNRPDDDGDDEGDGRGRRGRRFRDRRRGRDREPRPVVQGGNGQSDRGVDTDVRDDDVLLPVAGIIDVLDNYAFVRTTGYLSGPTDVYVSLSVVRKYGLRRGDAITGAVREVREGEQTRQKFNPLVRVDSINGQDPENSRNRAEFTKLTPLYPNDRLRLETEPHKLTSRVIDLVMPIGKGQRALIVSPPKAGKTMIMQAIANAITTNNPECHLMVVLVDERPEEVTDMQRSVKGEVIASTFDRPPSDHTTVAELAIERAKRLVEMGHDVVVLLDSITRLGRAYNLAAPASGRILSGGVDSTALYPPKRFLGAARNIEDGGSLTIFATALVETGSTMDTVIFEEFKGTGNAELKLDRKIADKRIFPAIDIDASGTRKEELLLSPDELAVTVKLRRVLSALDDQQALDLVLGQLKKTRTNIEFLMQVAKNTPGTDGD